MDYAAGMQADHPVVQAAIGAFGEIRPTDRLYSAAGLGSIQAVLAPLTSEPLKEALRSLLAFSAFLARDGAHAEGIAFQLLQLAEAEAERLPLPLKMGDELRTASAQLGQVTSNRPVGHDAPEEGAVRGPLALRLPK